MNKCNDIRFRVFSVFNPKLREDFERPGGETIGESLERAGMPGIVFPYLRICLDGEPLENAVAGLTRPLPGQLVAVGIVPAGDFAAPQNKDTLRVILTSAGLLGGQLVAGAFGLSGIREYALRAGIGILSYLAINALFPPVDDEDRDVFTLTGTRNQIRPLETVPEVAGKIRFFPFLAAAPFTEIQGDDQFIRVLLCLGRKPVSIVPGSWKIGDAPLADFTDGRIQLEVVDGFSTPDAERIQSFTSNVQQQNLRIELEHADSFEDSGGTEFEQVIHLYTEPDTVSASMDFSFSSGLGIANSAGVFDHTVKLRVQYREYDADAPGTWIDVYQDESVAQNQLEADLFDRTESFVKLTAMVTEATTLYTALDAMADTDKRWAALHADRFEDTLDRLDNYTTLAIAADSITVGEDAIMDTVVSLVSNCRGLLTDIRAAITAEDPWSGVFINPSTGIPKLQIAMDSLLGLVQVSYWQLLYTDLYSPLYNSAFSREFVNWQQVRRQFTAVWGLVDSEFNVIEYTDQRRGLVRRALSIDFPGASKWEVRIVKISEDNSGNEFLDDVEISAFRSVIKGAVLSAAAGAKYAFAALTVKASDGLSNSLDKISCVLEKPVRWTDDNGATWYGPAIEKSDGTNVSRNPGWIYVNALTDSNMNRNPVPDASLDATTIQTFADWCESNSFHFDHVFNRPTTSRRAVQDVLRVAKASPSMIDSLYSVVHDVAPAGSVAVITQRNSRNFRASKTMAKTIHAIDIQFLNPEKDWATDQWRVYNDGYTAANATEIEAINMPGLVDVPDNQNSEWHSGQVWKLGRYYLAVSALRPEVFQVEMDWEHLVFTRGDQVTINYDVVSWGLGAARLTAISGNDVTLDSGFTMVSGTSYKIRFRKSDGTLTTAAAVTNDPGEQLTVTLPGGVPSGVAVGDLAWWGVADSESVDCIVREIEGRAEQGATITLVEAAPAVHTSDTGTIPTFDPQITIPPNPFLILPSNPVIRSVQTNESVLARDVDGSFQCRIRVTLGVPKPRTSAQAAANAAVDAHEFQIRPRAAAPVKSPTPWQRVGIFPKHMREVFVPDVQQGQTYDLRVRALLPAGLNSKWTFYPNILIVGLSTPPPNVSKLNWEGDFIYWDYFGPPDVAGFEVRHVHGQGLKWGQAWPLFNNLVRESRFPLPLYENNVHTFFVKAVDVAGNESAEAASIAIDYDSAGTKYTLSDILQHEAPPSPGSAWTPDASDVDWARYENATIDGANELVADAQTYDGALMFYWMDEAEDTRAETDYDPDDAFWRADSAKFYHPAYKSARYIIPAIGGFGSPSAPSLPVFRGIFADCEGDGWRVEKRNAYEPLWPELDASNEPIGDVWPGDLSADFWPVGILFGAMNEARVYIEDGIVNGHSDGWRFRIRTKPGETQGKIKSVITQGVHRPVVETFTDELIAGSGSPSIVPTKTFYGLKNVSAVLKQDGSYPNAAAVEVVSYTPSAVYLEVFDGSHARTDGKVDLRIEGWSAE